MRVFGKGFNFSQDGPGNRLVYHLSGCNMHCIWCSNPEGMDRDAGKEYTFQELSPFIDYLIMDYKHFDCDILRNYTGMDNKIINNNFALNCANRKQQHIRIPLINGFNADNPNGFVKFFSQFDIKNTVFEFLPYHEYGKDKWRTPYLVQNGFVTDDVLRQFQRTFISCGLQIVST